MELWRQEIGETLNKNAQKGGIETKGQRKAKQSEMCKTEMC